MDVEKAIFASKEILCGRLLHTERFNTYSKCYFYTTENIKSYLNRLTYAKNRVSTVIGSGDQIFNLAYLGFKNIDAFDINVLTYFNFYLRRALILAFSYEGYMAISKEFLDRKTPLSRLKDLFNYLEDLLPDDVSYFYNALMIEQEKLQKDGFSWYNLFSNLYVYPYIDYNFIDYNLYMDGVESFYSLKEKLEHLDIHFTFDNVVHVASKLEGNYDLILLSNIVDYLHFDIHPFGVKELEQFMSRFYSLLREDGVLVNYLYSLSKKIGDWQLEDLPSNHLIYTNEGYNLYLMRK